MRHAARQKEEREPILGKAVGTPLHEKPLHRRRVKARELSSLGRLEETLCVGIRKKTSQRRAVRAGEEQEHLCLRAEFLPILPPSGKEVGLERPEVLTLVDKEHHRPRFGAFEQKAKKRRKGEKGRFGPRKPQHPGVLPPKGPEVAFPRHQRINEEINEGNGARPEGLGHERRLARPPPAREKERTAAFLFHARKVFEKPGGRFVAVDKGKAHGGTLKERMTSL